MRDQITGWRRSTVNESDLTSTSRIGRSIREMSRVQDNPGDQMTIRGEVSCQGGSVSHTRFIGIFSPGFINSQSMAKRADYFGFIPNSISALNNAGWGGVGGGVDLETSRADSLKGICPWSTKGLVSSIQTSRGFPESPGKAFPVTLLLGPFNWKRCELDLGSSRTRF